MHATTDIIVLVHNRLEITKGFVDHLFKATENFNLLFIDNHSTDGTPKYLKEGESTGKWRVLTMNTNEGIVVPRNVGAKLTKSDFFLNIDNDQYPRPGWLQKLHDLIDKGYDIAGCEAWKLQAPGSGGNLVMDGQNYPMDYFPGRHCSRKGEEYTYIGCGGMLIKRSVYNDIGLFDEQFSPAYFEDPDFCFRVIKAGYKLGWCADCPITHLGHQTIRSQSLFAKNKQFHKSWGRFKEKWNPYYPDPIRTK